LPTIITSKIISELRTIMITFGVDGSNRFTYSPGPCPACAPARLSPTGGLRRQAMTQRRVGTAALLAVLVAALVLTVPSLRDVVARIGDMAPGWVAAAVALELGSCLAFVAVFRYFFDRVEPRVARRVAWTELASGVLLPGGGVSSLAAGGWLMRLTGEPTRRIVRRSSALFFLTSAVNVAALAAAGALLATGISAGPHDPVRAGVPIAVGLGAIALALVAARVRRGSGWLGDLTAGIREARAALARPGWRVAGAVGYLGFDIAVLWATLRALGYGPAIGALVAAYLVGYLANWLPIPGGLGVLDGGLAGALVLYGMPPATAAAAVLVYHAIALWIPAAGGLVAYARLRRSLVERDHAQARRPACALRGAPDCQSSRSRQPARRLRSSDLPSSAPLRLAPWARRKKSASSLSPSRSAS
jgi:uncharacterized membrane protein YbhN (UPF0104 family)